jgi:hypothetical protein
VRKNHDMIFTVIFYNRNRELNSKAADPAAFCFVATESPKCSSDRKRAPNTARISASHCNQRFSKQNLRNQYFAGTLPPQFADSKDQRKNQGGRGWGRR